MAERVWSKDWVAALAFSLLFAVLAGWVYRDSFQGLERHAYDLGVQARERIPSDRVAVIAIDDESLRNLGRWPWPRSLQAAMLDLLREGGAKAVGNTIFYFEEQQDPGLQYLQEIDRHLSESSLGGQVQADLAATESALAALAGRHRPAVPALEAFRTSALATQLSPDLDVIRAIVSEASGSLSVDGLLADAMAAGPPNVVAMILTPGLPAGRPDQPLPAYVSRNALSKVVDRVNATSSGWTPYPTLETAQVPIPLLGAAADGIGHIAYLPDVDGAVRFEPLVLEHFGAYYPSMSLALAARALNLGNDDIEVQLGEGVALGNVRIGTTTALRMYTHFYGEAGGRPPFPVDSFFDVLSGKIPPSNYRDKIVLIGATAAGVGDAFPTPVSSNTPPVLVLAHAVSSILQQDFFTRPPWAGIAELGLFIVIAAYLAWVLPALGPGLAALVSGAFAVALLVSQLALLAGNAMWLKLVLPTVLLVTGHLFMTVKRLRLTEKLKLTSEAEGAESNKMLGLAFQGQGQLDMAFEKFRRIQPVDDKVLDLLYNLGLDFERKRQFNKAESVYQYIAQHNAQFRDVSEKTAKVKKMSETVILGSGGGSHPGGTMVLDGSSEKPMMGRYEVEKELGKGAMGVVYFGRDPKINRVVAIKTLALSQEFEADELDEVKARFFREAETAGRLNHPNIVAIYDLGEEHDLCFIAMEFLKGHDLTRYTKGNALMPVPKVIHAMIETADALDYAHQQGVVHRDIKPANLMLLEERDIVKITDFGIARITDASRTKTGMVLGTPSYMSPEQLSGKKVDGRSDLFSLGVTFYQMLTGALPFSGDSMATLMFKIANEEHVRIDTLRPDLPPGVAPIIDKMLQKDRDQRYQRGSEIVADLRPLAAGG